MHIGMIVGIGPAATDYYYRYLISAMAKAGHDLNLTMAHADTPTLLRHQAENNQAAQVAIYERLANRLMRCGVETIERFGRQRDDDRQHENLWCG